MQQLHLMSQTLSLKGATSVDLVADAHIRHRTEQYTGYLPYEVFRYHSERQIV